MKLNFIILIITSIFLAGCQSQKMTQAEADFSHKWKSATPSERREIIDLSKADTTNTVNLIDGYLKGKDRETVEDFLGKPSPDMSYNGLTYRTVGNGILWIHFDENQRVRACTILN